jgi:hypothetical protein
LGPEHLRLEGVRKQSAIYSFMADIDSIIKAEYPNARTGAEVTEMYLGFLEKEYNADLKKMLFATSLCSDDINVSTDFRRVLSRPFTMGGLGGLPYTGFTGMVAYGHHIPDGGDGFIFYGPHIGITDDGELGRMRRPGQKDVTNSCGALMLALERIKDKDGVYVPVNEENDYQQVLLERTVMPFKQQILTSANPVKEITDVTYQNIDQRIHRLVTLARDEFRTDRVFLLGGVIVNTSPELPDYVDIRHFEVIQVKNMQPVKTTSILETPAFKSL